MVKLRIPTLTCLRCAHRWVPRQPGRADLPRVQERPVGRAPTDEARAAQRHQESAPPACANTRPELTRKPEQAGWPGCPPVSQSRRLRRESARESLRMSDEHRAFRTL